MEPGKHSRERRCEFLLKPDRAILALLIVYYFTSYIFIETSFVRFIPLIAGIFIYFWIFVSGHFSIDKRLLPSWIFLSCFSILAVSYFVLEAGINSLFSMEFYFFTSLPFLYLSVSRLVENGGIKFLLVCCFIFLLWQLFVVFGQAVNNVFGYGLKLPAFYGGKAGHYTNMLTGTFFNANDLSASCGMLFIVFIVGFQHAPKISKIALLVCAVLVIATASRSVLVFVALSSLVFVLSRNFIPRLVFLISFFSLFSLLLYFYSDPLAELEIVARVVRRLDSLWHLLTEGVGGDTSIFLRLGSYLHFFENLADLGVGTISIRDYSYFIAPLGENFSLMGVNPHSFIIEIAYWLGWPGLLLFMFFVFSVLPKRPLVFIYVVAGFLLLSLVSSSVFNNFIFFIAFFAAISMASLIQGGAEESSMGSVTLRP